MKVMLIGGSGGLGTSIREELRFNHIDVIEMNSTDVDLSKKFQIEPIVVDGLIYCAGVNRVSEFDQIVDDDIVDTMNINAIGFARMCRQIQFSAGSNIVAIGSLYATGTRIGRLSYTMSKHALLGAVKSLALEMAPMRVKVNMVSPGFVNTELTRKNNTEERIKELNELIPLGMTASADIANICVFLIKKNRAITGQNIIVDGGYSLVGV